MKALSVRQPWADLISRGIKLIELRTWRTSYRGPLLICASKRKYSDLPVGVAVAYTHLVDIRPATYLDASLACCLPLPNEFAWILERTTAISQPFSVSGKLSLFEVAIPKMENHVSIYRNP